MNKFVVLMLILSCIFSSPASAENENPVVEMVTNYGTIVLELAPDKAPETVKNFLSYVDMKYYDQTIFHRVISGFMIQGGGMTQDMNRKETAAPIKNEADNGLVNRRGTIAMARTSEPHSATSQFFINLKDNNFLNFTSQTPNGWGYCVFGKVISGMEVVDKIATVETGSYEFYRDVPKTPVVILLVRRVETRQQESDAVQKKAS